MDGSVAIGEAAVELTPGGVKRESVPLGDDPSASAIGTSSSANVGAAQQWRAPADVRTSGSVVRNSMILLPADGSNLQSQSSESRQITSCVPVALSIDGAAVPPAAGDEHPARGHAAAQAHNAADSGEVLPHLSKPKEEAIGHDATTDAQQGEKSCTGSAGCLEVERDASCSAPTPVGKSNQTSDWKPLIHSGQDVEEAIHIVGEQERRPPAKPELAESTMLQKDDVTEMQVAQTDEPTVHVGMGAPSTHAGHETTEHLGSQDEPLPQQTLPPVEKAAEGCTTMLAVSSCVNCAFDPPTADKPAVELEGLIDAPATEGVEAPLQNVSSEARPDSQFVDGPSEKTVAHTAPINNDILVAEKNGTLNHEGTPQISTLCVAARAEAPVAEAERMLVSGSNTVNREQREVFSPSECFTGGKPGYVFKLGDKGLGFYVDGYASRPTQRERISLRRPWNAGPGEEAIRRGPMGPVHKLFKKEKMPSNREQMKAAEESDTRPFMARMVAQRNSRGFQTTLLDREHVLDEHILGLLEKFSDPTFFKKKHGYNVHGQMLGTDGKMIVKEKVVKTEEEKAKLSWYRKVYEDRLGEQLPSKRLGDSIEARREAYAYSRHFTAELNGREDELNRALTKALKGQTKLEFITEDYHYPGAYDTDGKVILEKGVPISNELHQTDEQKERACSYRFKAIQRFRTAHDDIVGAISNKDKALQKLFKKTDATLLQEIADDTVKGSGIGIYHQKKRVDHEGGNGGGSSIMAQPTESPEQLRDKFAQSLKVQIKGKDKALMKEVAALDENDTEQMIDDFGKGVGVLPGSWRQDPINLTRMQRRRNELIAEIAADGRKVVCPWRPGGMHIAHTPWQPFIPREHRPPVRAAAEGKSGTDGKDVGGPTAKTGEQHGSTRGSGNEQEEVGQRPHTAPTRRRKEFMDTISARAKCILAAQVPGTPLHSAFSTYSTDPFPLEPAHRPTRDLGPSRTESVAGEFSFSSVSRTGTSFRPSGDVGERRQQYAWAELSGPSVMTRAQIMPVRSSNGITRPHSAAAENPRRIRVPPRRPLTASEARNPASKNATSAAVSDGKAKLSAAALTHTGKKEQHNNVGKPMDLSLQSAPGGTVFGARLCGPSDLVHKSSTWPSRPRVPNASRPTRRRVRRSEKSTTDAVGTVHKPRTTREEGSGLLAGTAHGGPSDAEDSDEENVGHSDETVGKGAPLEDLENGLRASSWRRVNQRRRVFRGYAERSRKARTWDPGSEFFNEGASRHYVASAWSCRRGGSEGGRRGAAMTCREAGITTGQYRREQRHWRNRVCVDADRPVDMDWKEVDTGRFDEAADKIKAALEGKLFAVVTDDSGGEQLGDCFRQTQELVETAGELLGCPESTRKRFKQKYGGDVQIGNYVATVSRLTLLWTAACGVVEIVNMARRRENLLEVFFSLGDQPRFNPSTTGVGTTNGDIGREKSTAESPVPVTVLSQENHIRQYEKRLELAEYAVAIAKSLKLWLTIVPWRVQVLYGGEQMISRLKAEEEALPWPPDPGTAPDTDNAQGKKCNESVGTRMPEFGPHEKPCTPCSSCGDEETVSKDNTRPTPEEETTHLREEVQKNKP